MTSFTPVGFEFDDCDAFLASLNNPSAGQNDSSFSSGESPSGASLSGGSPHQAMLISRSPYSDNEWSSTMPFNSLPDDTDNGFIPGNFQSLNFMGNEATSSTSNAQAGIKKEQSMYSPNSQVRVKQEHSMYSPSSPSSNSDTGYSYESHPLVPVDTSSSVSSPPSAIEQNVDMNSNYLDFGLDTKMNMRSYTTQQSRNQQQQLPRQGQQHIVGSPISSNESRSNSITSPTALNLSSAAPTAAATASANNTLHKTISNSKVSKPKKEKTSHNMIEKRYRTNINDKILALRDCVPALRCAVVGSSTEEDLDGLTPAAKLNKATVLTKATEYIMHLQNRNALLMKEIADLRAAAANATGSAGSAGSASSVGSMATVLGNGNNSVNFMTGQESMNYFHPGHSTQHRSNSSTANKVMMCSMAGMMGAGLMTNDNGDSRGLSSVPFLGSILKSFVGSAQAEQAIVASVLYVKVALLLAVIFNLVIYPFLQSQVSTQSSSQKGSSQSSNSVSLRGQTFELISKHLNLPSDGLSKAVALAFVSMEIAVSTLIGKDGYSAAAYVLGRPRISEARHQWIRAMDAQLCGGDFQCTRFSLFYMLLKSHVLASTVQLCISRAIQCRMLSIESRHMKPLLDKLSRHHWNLAVKLSAANETPSHLKSLLACDFEDVFDHATINLMYKVAINGAEVFSGSDVDSEPYQSVVDDESIQTAADFLSALHSCRLSKRFLVQYLQGSASQELLEQTVNVAPADSVVSIRAVILLAFFSDKKQEGQMLQSAMKVASSNKSCLAADAKLTLTCAVIARTGQEKDANAACKLMNKIVETPSTMGLMGFAALYSLLENYKTTNLEGAYLPVMERLARDTRVWIGSKEGDLSGVSLERRRQLAGECVYMTAHYGGISTTELLDEGYASA